MNVRARFTIIPSGRMSCIRRLCCLEKFADDDMAWARDRASLWNTAERAETRSNARVAREYLIALPVELSPQQRVVLVRGFSQGLSDRYGYAVDLAIHAPRDFPGSDPRNFHAHLLTTTRVVAIEGLGAKTTLDMNDGNRREAGLGPAINELIVCAGAVVIPRERGFAGCACCRPH